MSLDKLIEINSDDKEESSSSNSNFTVALREKYYTQNVLKVLIKDCTVPNVFPNLRGTAYGTSQNNILVLERSDAVQFSITLPEGQYLINSTTPSIDFATQLKVQIDIITGDVVTITFSDLTGKFTLSFAGDTYIIYPTDNTLSINTPMSDVLGFSVQQGYVSQLIADSLPDLAGYQNVYLHSREIALSNAINSSKGLISIIESVNLSNTAYGAYANRQNEDDEMSSIVYDQIRNLSRVNIILRDNKGNQLPIGTHKINLIFKAYLDSG